MSEYPIVTICGSMRYYPVMLQLAQHLTASGHIVLMPFSTVEEGTDVKRMLDDMHRTKIDMSSTVYVVGQHIGESTHSEIRYADATGKTVMYAADPANL